MTPKNQRISFLGMAVAVAFTTSIAWSQNQNQYDEQQRDRYVPGGRQYEDQNQNEN